MSDTSPIASTASARLLLTSADPFASCYEELKALFPMAVTDGRVDLEKLRALIGGEAAAGAERYGLSWAGKSDALKVLRQLTTATLLPAPSESVNWDTTGNAIIEGDNLEVLKVLQHAYHGKVKLIYIDPPYNTGGDFIYPDDYAEGLKSYLQFTRQKDEEGRKLTTNLNTSGRYHSRWLTMIYPRLFIARSLLREDGVIFVSINDVEVAALRLVMDEIFGEECFVAQFVWNNEGNVDNQSKVKSAHEYVLCFSRTPGGFARPEVIDPNIEETSKLYNDEIENSITKNGPANPVSEVSLPVGFPAAFQEGVVEPREDDWPKIHDRIVVSNRRLARNARVSSGWSSRRLLDLFISNGFIPIKDSEGKETRFALTATGAVYVYKRRPANQGHVLSVIRNVGTTKQTSGQLADWGIDFPYPKPTRLVRYLIEIAAKQDRSALIVDFFAGSGTTGHAVMELNKEDGGQRRYILVQLPEPTGKTEFPTIAEITKKRIRCAIQLVKGGAGDQFSLAGTSVDLGFKVFKLAPSNFAVWDPAIAASDPARLAEQWELTADNVRSGAQEQALLYELMLKCGLPLSAPAETVHFAGLSAFRLDEGKLVICLARTLTQEALRAIIQLKPQSVLCLDVGFKGNDALKVNAQLEFQSHGIQFRTA